MGAKDGGGKAGKEDFQVDAQEKVVLDATIANEAMRAWLSAFFSSPAAHRANAQAGYTVAAAVAAAVVGAGILASIDSSPLWLQAAAAITLALWLVAAWRFMRAVAIQPNLDGVVHKDDASTLADRAIERTWKERRVIARRSWAAQKTARVAGIATFVTVVLAMVQPGPATTSATVVLAPAGVAHYTKLCGGPADSVPARLDPSDLSDEFVELTEVQCGGEADTTLRLRREDIAGLRSR